MVMDAKYPLESIGQLYGDRADYVDLGFCKNGFDELKNQWGLWGFTTQDITAKPQPEPVRWSKTGGTGTAEQPIRARIEAITSRPMLLAAVGRAAQSGGQTTLALTPLHGKANLIEPLIANIHAALRFVKEAAEQIKSADPWSLLLRYVDHKIAPMIGPFSPPTAVTGTG